MMNDEGIFPRLLELIKSKLHEDIALHRMLLELLYEMSRINRIRMEELCTYSLASMNHMSNGGSNNRRRIYQISARDNRGAFY